MFSGRAPKVIGKFMESKGPRRAQTVLQKCKMRGPFYLLKNAKIYMDYMSENISCTQIIEGL